MRLISLQNLKKAVGTFGLALAGASAFAQSQCRPCPILQGLPDTIQACKNSTFALPVPFLSAIPTGTVFFDTSWTPITGLSNPFAQAPGFLSTSASVTTGGRKYVLRVRTIDTNIALNSGFPNSTLATSTTTPPTVPAEVTNYIQNQTSVASPSTYAITTNPSLVNSSYSSFGDHTSGTGKMMVVNGSNNNTLGVYGQTFSVCPGKDYQFKCYVASASPSTNTAILRFRINGTQLAPAPFTVNLSPSPGAWVEMSYIWTSTGTTATVEIIDQNTNTNGNDFAIDDFTIRPMCSLKDSTYINVTNLRPLINHTERFGCTSDTADFTADTSVFPGVPATIADSYLWRFGDGATSTQQNPTHVYTQQGVYTVRLYVYKTTSYGTQSVTCVDSAFSQVDTRHPFYAGFTQDKDTICKGAKVTFTDTSFPATGLISAWDFGDKHTSNQESPFNVYDTVGVFTVRQIVTDFLGCNDTAYGEVVSVGQPPVSFTVSDTVLCAGGTTNLFATVPGSYRNFKWNLGDGRIVLDSVRVRHAYITGGQYEVTFTADHPVCPPIKASDTVLVYDLPRVNLGTDTFLCPMGQPVLVQNQVLFPQPNLVYHWNTGDATPSLLVRHDGDYWLTATNPGGCQATDSIHIAKNCYLDIPNVFTPDNDGSNDYFLPRQILGRGVSTFKLQIMNRWGQTIYQTTRIDGRGWDGKFNGQDQPLGVYLYFIEATFQNGAVEKYQGNITLLR
jgi:gliding motility-associated-like protein